MPANDEACCYGCNHCSHCGHCIGCDGDMEECPNDDGGGTKGDA